jgi:hypothetical protein
MSGYDLEVLPYSHLSSFESGKGMTGHHIKFYASGNEVTSSGSTGTPTFQPSSLSSSST